MSQNIGPDYNLRIAAILTALVVASGGVGAQQTATAKFHLQDASISDIQRAIVAHQITSVGLVNLYLKRIKTYNNTCVNQPTGILGPITTIPHARQINALSTLNLRPATRKAWGFDERKARSMTDAIDNDPAMLGRARGGGRSGSPIQADRKASRSATWSGYGDQRPIRHI